MGKSARGRGAYEELGSARVVVGEWFQGLNGHAKNQKSKGSVSFAVKGDIAVFAVEHSLSQTC